MRGAIYGPKRGVYTLVFDAPRELDPATGLLRRRRAVQRTDPASDSCLAAGQGRVEAGAHTATEEAMTRKPEPADEHGDDRWIWEELLEVLKRMEAETDL